MTLGATEINKYPVTLTPVYDLQTKTIKLDFDADPDYSGATSYVLEPDYAYKVTAKIQLPKTARAPVTQGEIAGTVTFYKGERQVGRTYLVWGKSAGQDVISQDSPRSPLGMLKRWTGEESTA